MTEPIKLPPLPEKSYLGDDASYGYESWDMEEYARSAIEADRQDSIVFECGKAAGRQEVKDAQKCPDFWAWIRRAYREPESAAYTVYNMEVAYQAGRASAEAALQSQDREDAERYRWLRQQHWSDSELCVVASPKRAVMPGFSCPSQERLDEAIDRARRAEGRWMRV